MCHAEFAFEFGIGGRGGEGEVTSGTFHAKSIILTLRARRGQSIPNDFEISF